MLQALKKIFLGSFFRRCDVAESARKKKWRFKTLAQRSLWPRVKSVGMETPIFADPKQPYALVKTKLLRIFGKKVNFQQYSICYLPLAEILVLWNTLLKLTQEILKVKGMGKQGSRFRIAAKIERLDAIILRLFLDFRKTFGWLKLSDTSSFSVLLMSMLKWQNFSGKGSNFELWSYLNLPYFVKNDVLETKCLKIWKIHGE